MLLISQHRLRSKRTKPEKYSFRVGFTNFSCFSRSWTHVLCRALIIHKTWMRQKTWIFDCRKPEIGTEGKGGFCSRANSLWKRLLWLRLAAAWSRLHRLCLRSERAVTYSYIIQTPHPELQSALWSSLEPKAKYEIKKELTAGHHLFLHHPNLLWRAANPPSKAALWSSLNPK